jgi:hypothetical protein
MRQRHFYEWVERFKEKSTTSVDALSDRRSTVTCTGVKTVQINVSGTTEESAVMELHLK